MEQRFKELVETTIRKTIKKCGYEIIELETEIMYQGIEEQAAITYTIALKGATKPKRTFYDITETFHGSYIRSEKFAIKLGEVIAYAAKTLYETGRYEIDLDYLFARF